MIDLSVWLMQNGESREKYFLSRCDRLQNIIHLCLEIYIKLTRQALREYLDIIYNIDQQ